MTVEHAQRHLDKDHKSGMVNCASMCLAAILPFEPSARSLEVASNLRGDLEPLIALAIQELDDHRIGFIDLTMKPDIKPSDFFHKIYRLVRHERSNIWFIGAFIQDKAVEPEKVDGFTYSHVIAVTKLHQHRKATIVDTNPYTITNPQHWFSKKVPLRTLDRRITNDVSRPWAIALLGFHLISQESYSTEKARHYFDIIMEMYQDKAWETTTKLRELEEIADRNGRTKRRYRLDRRIHEVIG